MLKQMLFLDSLTLLNQKIPQDIFYHLQPFLVLPAWILRMKSKVLTLLLPLPVTLINSLCLNVYAQEFLNAAIPLGSHGAHPGAAHTHFVVQQRFLVSDIKEFVNVHPVCAHF